MTHPNEVTDSIGKLFFEDKLEAMTALSSIKLKFEKNGFATVGDLCYFVEKPFSTMVSYWGWRDISDFSITEDEGKYQLNYPEPERI